MIIRKWNGTDTWAAQSIETDLRALRTTNAKLGSTTEADYPFDSNLKIKAAHLPDAVFGGMKFVGTVGYNSNATDTLEKLIQGGSTNWTISSSLDSFTGKTYSNGDYAGIGQQYIGYYWVVSSTVTIGVSDSAGGAADFQDHATDDGADQSTGAPYAISVEHGDWLIITGWDNANSKFLFDIVNNTYKVVSTSSPGIMSAADKTKLDGIATSANNYTHPTYDGDDINLDTGALTGATVISDLDFNITSDNQGHITDANATVNTRTLTLADLGYTGATNANNYVHPTHPGDDFSIDTGPLTGATVISDLDINISSDTSGHITDANATVSTRTLTLADLGYTAPGNGTHTVSGTTDQVSISTAGGAFTANKGTLTTTTVSLSYPVYYADTQAGLSTDSSVPENAIGFEY